jgi:spore germination protein YaaH
MKRILFLFSAVLATASSLWAAPVALFYMTESPDSIRSFLAHSTQIDLLVPTWYQVDENGLVSGAPDPAVLDRAHQENLPVMPIVALMNDKKFHALAGNPAAQAHMNEAMIRESKLHGYSGFQFDFEDIDWTDSDLLTALVKSSAEAMHGAGLKLTIATVPNEPGYPGQSAYSTWMYSEWRGAYDIAALAKYVDLVCLMTYDQHSRWTAPGPVGGWAWTVDNLRYALEAVPKDKLSLGIPLYGYHWYAGPPVKDPTTGRMRPNPTADSIGTPDVLQLVNAYNGKIQWDAEERSAYVYFTRDQLREWIFFTDARTFKERYDLVQQSGLEGFCSWVLGDEDPAIWKILPERPKAGER